MQGAGAGPSVAGDRWIEADPEFFIHVQVLSAFFKKSFVRHLDHAYRYCLLELDGQLEELQHPVAFQDFLGQLAARDWVVFSKRPFSRPETVLEYLARYTHRRDGGSCRDDGF